MYQTEKEDTKETFKTHKSRLTGNAMAKIERRTNR